MAELVSLAPPPVNELPVNNAKTFDHCAGDQTARSSGIRYAFCEVGSYIHSYREDINAVSTFLLMLFTIVLILLNGSLARSTRIAAIAAERAAVAAEKGLTELERPWVFLEGTTITRKPGERPSVPNAWYISLHFKNAGRMSEDQSTLVAPSSKSLALDGITYRLDPRLPDRASFSFPPML